MCLQHRGGGSVIVIYWNVIDYRRERHYFGRYILQTMMELDVNVYTVQRALG